MFTYLNKSNNKITQAMQIPIQEMNNIDLNKLNGLHILNKAINPETIKPKDAIVTNCPVDIGINI